MAFLDRFFPRRETAAERQAWLDTTVRAIGQRLANDRLGELRQASRSFEAAETPAWTDSWPTHAAHINQDLARQLPTLRARARGQGRNNEWATNYLIKLDDNVLGENGIALQSRLKKASGEADSKTNAKIEAAYTDWGKVADVSGLSWREVESLGLRSLAVDGELLYRLRPGAGPYGFQIQMLPPELIDVNLHRDWGKNRVRMGVEIDDDGKPVAYWLQMVRTGDLPGDLLSVGRHVRFPADQIVHRFLKTEVGQVRGYPWLSAGARRLWMLHDFEEAASVASTNAAKRQGFFVSPNGDAPPGFADTMVSAVLDAAKAAGKVLSPDEIKALTDAAEKYSTTVPGQYDTLPQGYDFRPYESKWPEVSAEGYVKQHVRGWAAARGMSYVSIGNDLEAVNYSSARVGIVEEREHYKTIQGRLRAWLHEPVLAAVFPYLVLYTPALKMERLDAYKAAATWQPRRWAGIDPVKEADADERNLRNKLTSRRRILLSRGEDPDEIAAEIAEEEKLYGPVPPANAPAQPAKDDAGKDGEGGQ